MADPLRVLIIDDDPVDRQILKEYLEQGQPQGFVFAEEGSGRAGVQKCDSFQPDCILLDFNLPDVDGLTILQSLRKSTEAVKFPIVMLTAIGNEQLAVEAMKLGAMDYLPKGVANYEALHRTVWNAVQRFQMQQEISSQRKALQERNKELEAIRERLLEEKEKYRTVTDAIPQLVWTASSDGSIEYANRQLQDYSGRPEGVTWRLASMVHAEDRKRLEAGWQTATAVGDIFEMEVRFEKGADKSVRWHLVRALPLRFAEGQLVKWFGTCTDIEDQKRNEEAVRQHQKLDSIGLLAGGIAHDFNNLLVGIMGGASFALDSLSNNHPVRSTLEIVIKASEKAAHLTQQLLAYAGKSQTFVQPVDVAQVVRDSCDLVRTSIPKSVHLLIQTAPDLPLLETNLGQLEQVIMNLLLNAAEAIGDQNGIVTIRTRVGTIQAEALPRNVLGYEIIPGPYLSIEVSDTGAGMDKETQSRIFDPFFTTKFTGRGLGLAAVQGIVRSFHGAIGLTSAPGNGSTFLIVLPAVRADRNSGDAETIPQQNRAQILVIDDEELVRTTAKLSLERAGHSVLVAEDGIQGLAALRRLGDKPSLILLDMSMPHMSGTDCLREIRKISPDVAVAIVSGYSEEDVARRFAGFKVAGFIQKPFKARSLVAAVNAILENASPQIPAGGVESGVGPS